MLANPGVNVLGGRCAVLEGGADPSLARDDGSDGGLIGEQDAGPVCQGHLCLVAADGLNFHGSFAVEPIVRGQRRSWSAVSASRSAVT